MSCFTHNYLRLSLSSQKFERSNSQILSFAFGFFIYSIIGPDLVSIVDQVLRQAAPWINWVYCFVECSRDFYRENFSPTEPSHQILLSSSLKKVIPSDSNWFQVIPIDSKWFQLIPSDSNWFQVIPIDSKWFQLRDLKLISYLPGMIIFRGTAEFRRYFFGGIKHSPIDCFPWTFLIHILPLFLNNS